MYLLSFQAELNPSLIFLIILLPDPQELMQSSGHGAGKTIIAQTVKFFFANLFFHITVIEGLKGRTQAENWGVRQNYKGQILMLKV